jgi:hypothetical protein
MANSGDAAQTGKRRRAKRACVRTRIWEVPQGRLNFRPVQIGFQRCLGSATALSLERPSPCCHPERSRADLRCALRVPRSYRPTTSTNLNTKSGGSKPTCPGVPWRDLRFRGPLLETRNDKGEVGFSRMIRDDSWRLWAGRSGALEGRTARSARLRSG